MIARVVVLALAVSLAPLPAAAQDAGSLMNSTKMVRYRFISIPTGAAIEYHGVVEGFTDDILLVKKDYVKTIRLLLEGYLPCTEAEAEQKVAKMGIDGVGTVFSCRLQGDPAKVQEWELVSPDGPAGPVPPEIPSSRFADGR